MSVKINLGQGAYEIIDDNGKLQNSPALTLSNPRAEDTVIEVKKLPAGGVYGFISGGSTSPSPTAYSTIDRFPFNDPSQGVSNVGNLTITRRNVSSVSSSSDGYVANGNESPGIPALASIDKFPFAMSGGTATDIGDLHTGSVFPVSVGTGHQSLTHGHVAGGAVYTTRYSARFKFPFAQSSAYYYTVGNLSIEKGGGTGFSSEDHGFVVGGFNPSPPSPSANDMRIDKFPFAVDFGSSSNVGELSLVAVGGAGVQSSSDAYYCGGYLPITSTETQDILKFPFAITSGNSTDVGDLALNTTDAGGHYSKDKGYVSGGMRDVTPTVMLDDVQVFSFANVITNNYPGALIADVHRHGHHQV